MEKSTLRKFRKKPVVIEADQFLIKKVHPLLGHDEVIHIPEGVMSHKGCGYRMCDLCGGANPDETVYYIKTLEGNMYVSNEDWIITGVKGEKYPCKPDIFDLTYEPIE
jgi:hypothetical protein